MWTSVWRRLPARSHRESICRRATASECRLATSSRSATRDEGDILMERVILNVNGADRSMVVDPEKSLAEVLRNQLLLTGCKVCCSDGQCGACTVMVDGEAIRACMIPFGELPKGAKITTIEGLGTPGNLHPLQMAWMAYGGAQCGICTPGFLMSAKVLL